MLRVFYGVIVGFANAFVESECARFEIHAGPATLELRPADPELDRSIDCNTGDCGAKPAGDGFVQIDAGTAQDQEG